MLFKDTASQHDFDQDGYAVLPAVLDSRQVAAVRELYHGTVTDKIEDQMYFSVAHAKKEAAILVDREIRAILNEPVERRFQDPITSCYQFIVKAPSGKHVLPPHQDLTAVMEPEERAAMVWIPMVDVDENSGAVGLVRGSHRFFDDVRCSPTGVVPSAVEIQRRLG